MMIRQAAFDSNLSMLRGALHCHTTRSDGQREPAELLRSFAQKGYDFVALTDHDRYNFINYAPDTGLLVIPGVETEGDIKPADRARRVHTFHHVGLGRAYEAGHTFGQDEHIPRLSVADQYEFIPRVEELQRRGNLTICCHPE